VKSTDAPAARSVLEGRADGKLVLFVGAERQPGLLRGIERTLAERGEAACSLNFTDLDRALEWCEERLLNRYDTAANSSVSATLATQEICRGLDEAGLAALQPFLVRRRFAPGELVLRVGEAADAMYFLLEGRVSVLMTRDTGEPQRITTLSPGMAFGELAPVTHSRRSADVRADSAVDCYALSADGFAELGRTHPAVKMKLLENMLRQAVEVVARLNQEVVARQL
jgi:glutaminase